MKAMFGAQKVIRTTGHARKAGVPNEALDTVTGWREAPWFSAGVRGEPE